MIHSMKYDYYKFPGGGIEQGEDPAEAMIRETREETGLVVIPETVKEYGLVHRIQKSDSDPTEVFIQDNYYYLCDAEETVVSQHLDGYESKEDYRLEFVDPDAAIEKRRNDIVDEEKKIEEAEKKIATYAEFIPKFKIAADYYRTRSEKYRVLGTLPQSEEKGH